MANGLGWGYPAGAENDPNAPWNQDEPEVEAVDVTVYTTMTRDAVVYSSDVAYTEWRESEKDKEGNLVVTGGTDRSTSNCDFVKDFKDEHMTLGQLLTAFKDMLKDRIAVESDTLANLKLRRYLREAEAWVEGDIEIEEA